MGGERIVDFKQLAVGLIFFVDFQGTLKERKKPQTLSFPQTLGWKTPAYMDFKKPLLY